MPRLYRRSCQETTVQESQYFPNHVFQEVYSVSHSKHDCLETYRHQNKPHTLVKLELAKILDKERRNLIVYPLQYLQHNNCPSTHARRIPPNL